MTTIRNRIPPLALLALLVWIAAISLLIGRYSAGGAHRVYAFNDYVLAGYHWAHGEYLYGNWRGFIYSPIVAAFFVLFAALPSKLAYALWLLLNVSVFLGGLTAFLRSDTNPNSTIGGSSLIYLLLVPCALGNLDVGQANPFVIGLLMFAFAAVRQERWNLAAACIGIATFFKIYPLAAGLLICVTAPRHFIWRLALALLALAAAPYLFQHWPYVTEQYHAWFATRASDNRLGYSVKYEPIDLWFLIRRIAHLPVPQWLYTLIQVGAGALIALLSLWGRWKDWSTDRIVCGMFFLVTIWMTLLGPATEAHTYLLMAAPLVIALVKAFQNREPILLRGLLSAAFVLQMIHTTRISYLFHSKRAWVFIPQPLSALLFLASCLLWLFDDSLWERAPKRS